MFAGEIIAGAMLGSFICQAPIHDDASTVRCANQPAIVRLMGIDTPAMPATCQPGDTCPPGDPFAAREALRALSLGRPLACEAAGIDARGRTLARCRTEDTDLSCAMLATGYAIRSKTAGTCDCTPLRPRQALLQTAGYGWAVPAVDDADEAPIRMAGLPVRDTPWSLPVAGAMVAAALWLAMANLALMHLAHERWPARSRWGAPMDKINPRLFLGLAAAGAVPAAWTALRTRHAGRQRESLLPQLVNITGVQIGLVLGALWWCFFG